MGTLRRRLATTALLLVPVVVVAGCGSSSPSTSSSQTTVDESRTIPTTSPPASVLPTTTTVPGSSSSAAICRSLTTALRVDELQPKDTPSWTLERQRVTTDAATNAALYDAAKAGAPADLVTALDQVAAYARFIGTAVQSAANFGAAVTAIGAYPDKVGASMATATMDTWRRANCPA